MLAFPLCGSPRARNRQRSMMFQYAYIYYTIYICIYILYIHHFVFVLFHVLDICAVSSSAWCPRCGFKQIQLCALSVPFIISKVLARCWQCRCRGIHNGDDRTSKCVAVMVKMPILGRLSGLRMRMLRASVLPL